MSKLDVAACLAAFDVAAERDQERQRNQIALAQKACAAIVANLPERITAASQTGDAYVRADIATDVLGPLVLTGSGWSTAVQNALEGETGVTWAVGNCCIVGIATLEAAIRRMAREATTQEEAP